MLLRQLQKFPRHLHIAAEHNTRHFVGHDPSHHLCAVIHALVFHICVFHMPDDLNPVMIKIIKKTCQLQRRTVDIRLGDLDVFQFHLRSEALQIHLVNTFLQCYSIHNSHLFPQ